MRPCASSCSPSGSAERTRTKFPATCGQSKPAAMSDSRMRSRSATVTATSPRRGSRSAAAAIAAAGPEIGAGARRSVSSAAVSGCASAYPTRNDASPKAFDIVLMRDEVRQLVHPRHDRLAAELEVRLVAHDDRPAGSLARSRRSPRCASSSPGRIVRIAEPMEIRLGRRLDELRTAKLRRNAVHRVGRRRIRGAEARPEEHRRKQQDEIVGAGARPRRSPARGRSTPAAASSSPLIGAVRVLVQPGHALGERYLWHTGKWRRVLVELEYLGRAQPMTLRRRQRSRPTRRTARSRR